MRPRVPGYRVTSPHERRGDTNLWHATTEADETPCLILMASAPLDGDREAFDFVIAQYSSLRQHPGIVTVHGGGLTDEGTPFLAVDADLTEPLSAPLPLEEALATMIRVSSAVEHLHALNLLHRSITPAHVFRTHSGGAKLAILPFPGDTNPLRLAPEEMREAEADERVDVYGLGVTLWELVGTADLPVTLQTLLAAAVADDPEHRIPTVREFRTRLQEIEQQLGTTVTRVPAVPKAADPVTGPVSVPFAAVHALDAVTRVQAKSSMAKVAPDDATRVRSNDIWQESPPAQTTKRRRIGRGMPLRHTVRTPVEDTAPRYVANVIPEPTKTGQIGVVPYDPGTQRVSERMYKPRVHERRRVIAVQESAPTAMRVTQPVLRHRLRRTTVGIITVGILVMMLSAWGFVALMT